jgi:hypothetical protein
MVETAHCQGAKGFRWIACGVATLAAVLHLVHLGSDILSSPRGISLQHVAAVQVVLAGLLVLYCASLLLCWKWLTTSGWLSLAFVAGFVGVVLWRGAPPAWSVWWVVALTMLMLTLPSVLLLAAGWVWPTARKAS